MSGVIPVRMAIEARRLAMSSPSRVGDSGVRIEFFLHVGLSIVNKLLQLSHLAHFLECKDLILFVAIYGQTCGIIPSVFES